MLDGAAALVNDSRRLSPICAIRDCVVVVRFFLLSPHLCSRSCWVSECSPSQDAASRMAD